MEGSAWIPEVWAAWVQLDQGGGLSKPSGCAGAVVSIHRCNKSFGPHCPARSTQARLSVVTTVVRPPLALRATSAHMQKGIDLVWAWKHLRAQASSSCWLELNDDKALDVDSEFSARAIVAAEGADTTSGGDMVSVPSRVRYRSSRQSNTSAATNISPFCFCRLRVKSCSTENEDQVSDSRELPLVQALRVASCNPLLAGRPLTWFCKPVTAAPWILDLLKRTNAQGDVQDADDLFQGKKVCAAFQPLGISFISRLTG
ncbi:hypothetical protein CEP51_009867 [Fusarium floridanum]|uniref:Uncharacterized protein n=1 Tax=Fusarium floridanum TaxID=1325733 RepID=A0A428RGA4_9HYPO|nr:hypothetical protein CEP51_009867 [Fusarium floridanum]